MDQLPDAKEVLEKLYENSRPFKEIKSYSDSPGIYGVFFYGSQFPLKDLKVDSKKGILIYIGKTESSQLKRDVNQHFTDGRTGSSTLRRSLGALLRTQLELNPIPRSTKERSDNKYTMYKFDEKSEKELTLWMKGNLGLAFFNFNKTSKEIGQLEENLIQLAVPPFNLQDNPDNPYSAVIMTARKSCMEAARANLIEINDNTQSQQLTQNDYIPRDIKQITLHEAMIEVLKNYPNKTASFKFLADEIKNRKLYFRKDGQSPPTNQLRARANNYPKFFENLPGGEIRLKK